jgi:hypothetical protein
MIADAPKDEAERGLGGGGTGGLPIQICTRTAYPAKTSDTRNKSFVEPRTTGGRESSLEVSV